MRESLARMDAQKAVAGMAHADSVVGSETARRWGRTPRSGRYWAKGGHPAVRSFFEYLDRLDDPHQMAAEIMAYAKQCTLRRLSNEKLIERVRDLLILDKEVEYRDTAGDLSPATTWEEMHRLKRTDAAVNAELAGAVAECMARGINRREVLHG